MSGPEAFELVVDPILIGPPSDGDISAWMRSQADIGALIRNSCLRVTCAQSARDEMVALWYAASGQQEGPATHELARVAHEFASRLEDPPRCANGTPIVEALSIDPPYVAKTVSPISRQEFEDHLGEAACTKHDGGIHVGILGSDNSWERSSKEITVEAEIIGRDDELDDFIEVEESESQLRELLPRSDDIAEVLERCCDHPGALLARFPDFGVRALWAVQFGGDPWGLEFNLGSTFASSVREMNYLRRPGEAKRCLRVMALIAGGRAGEVEGHEQHEGPGTTSAVVKIGGDPVIRSYLSNHVADAHRLFWIRGEQITFLNVSGHEGNPAL